MVADIEQVPELLAYELATLWRAHAAVGLSGFMQLYTRDDQVPFRAKQAGLSFWFGPDDNEAAIAEIIRHYNSGQLPNTPLLLNPIVHKKEGGDYVPLGSGFAWCTSLSLGVDVLNNESGERLQEAGAIAGLFERGDNDRAGLKILAFTTEAQPPTGDGKTVTGCRELYELAHIKSEQYAGHYLLSGISYLTNNGLFQHPDFRALFKSEVDIKTLAINVQNVIDAAYCWNAYDHHHSLYQKFGRKPANVEQNLRFFNLVARDVRLFDATGPMRKEADAMFEFIVPGWIPRGAVTLLAASGGTGKSSLAHQLCVMGAIDYKKGEEAPKWLGQRLAIEKCTGINVYFAGEDGPPIINARAALFDPKGRAKRLMFQRTDFGEGVTFPEYLRSLHKIPEVPIMVIDPARKYLTGDENDAGAVSEFFEAIEEFAIKKNTAVVVVHHLQKNAYPKTAREVLDMLRGSQVFIDRPRVVIGMFRDGPYTIAGLAKNNIPPNMGMVAEERVFARDPQHLSLIWMPGDQGIRNAALSEEELEALAEEAKKEGRI
ncbi:MAG: AAA family ATPase [Alphaproteobacteria bacterium]|nr:AAA family ATPase [Alphaproteobacteria bacterium]